MICHRYANHVLRTILRVLRGWPKPPPPQSRHGAPAIEEMGEAAAAGAAAATTVPNSFTMMLDRLVEAILCLDLSTLSFDPCASPVLQVGTFLSYPSIVVVPR